MLLVSRPERSVLRYLLAAGLVPAAAAGALAHLSEAGCAALGVERAAALGRRFDDLAVPHSHYLRLRGAVRELLGAPARDHERVEITVFVRGRDHHYVLRETPFRMRDGA